MKVEKLSETQIKFILSQTDLLDRNIRVNELAYNTEKTEQLFREMMEQAMTQCQFNAENTPLMVEAIPLSVDSVMILVTKISDLEPCEKRQELLDKVREVRKRTQQETQYKKHAIAESRSESDQNSSDSRLSIYSFATLDEVMVACTRLVGRIKGNSILFKSFGRFYLLISATEPGDLSIESIELILNEYGQKHISNKMSAFYLIEHAETLVQDDAVRKLALTLNYI
ncbi:MAG: adaptor protein MecA [Clostridiales bacterium]|jgi:adapter protein MecA 1/2|nr:adaptor protein MecA [Clostridiales bacterium]